MSGGKVIDLGVAAVPEATKLDEPWIFRAACMLKAPEASAGVLAFGLILNLGFGLYKQIDALLEGYLIVGGKADLAVEFAANWAVNGQPNPLEVVTISPTEQGGDLGRWFVHVYRVELALETLEALGRTSLGRALEEQGLAMCVKDAEFDA